MIRGRDLPLDLHLETVEARRFRPGVEEGSIPYSAVTQPEHFPSRKSGTFSSTVAVQRTRVFPHS